MSVNEKRITVFLKDGSQEKIVIESGTEKLKERERLNKMTEEEIDQAARSDPDALPVGVGLIHELALQSALSN
jgi:hypothetical protein